VEEVEGKRNGETWKREANRVSLTPPTVREGEMDVPMTIAIGMMK
jgi:hypothetical protein